MHIETSLRASDADREQVAERLRQATPEGWLNADELEGRLQTLFAARTYGELDALLADLGPPLLLDPVRVRRLPVPDTGAQLPHGAQCYLCRHREDKRDARETPHCTCGSRTNPLSAPGVFRRGRPRWRPTIAETSTPQTQSAASTNPQLCRPARTPGRRVPLWADELPDGSQVIAAPSATVQKLWWPPSMSSPAWSVHMGRSCAWARRAGAVACRLKPRFPLVTSSKLYSVEQSSRIQFRQPRPFGGAASACAD